MEKATKLGISGASGQRQGRFGRAQCVLELHVIGLYILTGFWRRSGAAWEFILGGKHYKDIWIHLELIHYVFATLGA